MIYKRRFDSAPSAIIYQPQLLTMIKINVAGVSAEVTERWIMLSDSTQASPLCDLLNSGSTVITTEWRVTPSGRVAIKIKKANPAVTRNDVATAVCDALTELYADDMRISILTGSAFGEVPTDLNFAAI